MAAVAASAPGSDPMARSDAANRANSSALTVPSSSASSISSSSSAATPRRPRT